MRAYLTEFIGIYFLVLTIGLTVLGGTPFAPLAIGASLMIMVFMGGHVSGAHYNPAVSIACAMRKKLPWSEVPPYIAAQLVGAVAAALTVSGILGQTFTLTPAEGISATRAASWSRRSTPSRSASWCSTWRRSRRPRGIRSTGWRSGSPSWWRRSPADRCRAGPSIRRWDSGRSWCTACWATGTLGDLWIYIVGPLLGAVGAAGAFAVQGEE